MNPWRWIVQLLCRHDYMKQRDSGRLYQRCTKCGHETPGFILSESTRL